MRISIVAIALLVLCASSAAQNDSVTNSPHNESTEETSNSDVEISPDKRDPADFVFEYEDPEDFDPNDVDASDVDAMDYRFYIPISFIALGCLVLIVSRRQNGDRRKGSIRIGFGLIAIGALLGVFQLIQGQSKDGSTRTRTRNGACSFSAEFGVRIVGPNRNRVSRDFLFTELDKGLWLHSNGHVEIVAKDVHTTPQKGRLLFIFYHGPNGQTEFGRIDRRINSAVDLRSFNTPTRRGGTSPPAPSLNLPLNMSANNKNPYTERIRVVATFTPEGTTDRCSPITGELSVQWRWNGNTNVGSSFIWRPFGKIKKKHKAPPHRSRVSVGKTIVDETTGIPGSTNKATPTTIYFDIEDPFSCCGQPNKPYTIIQFVRHRWRVGANGPLKCDQWNLDGPESQSQRHANGQEYDPTYTTDPKHGASTANQTNELVNIGPWDSSGGSAVEVKDFPGLLDADHTFFLREGGLIEWEFVTLLVCREDHGSVSRYLRDGHVKAKSHFRIRRSYPGNGGNVQIGGETMSTNPIGSSEYYRTCQTLRDVLNGMGLLDEFQAPRSHQIALRQGGQNCQ